MGGDFNAVGIGDIQPGISQDIQRFLGLKSHSATLQKLERGIVDFRYLAIRQNPKVGPPEIALHIDSFSLRAENLWA
jgi:hypothetical protein